MSEPRGLHPETRTQRRRHGKGWARPADDRALEPSDAPAAAVAKGLGWTGAGLVAIVAGVLLVTRLAEPRSVTGPGAAHARFRTTGPPLLPAPKQALLDEQAAHRPPPEAAMHAAMARVIAQGWGGDATPPDRAETAMNRAESNR